MKTYKGYMMNAYYPEGCIAEQVLYKIAIALCCEFLGDVKMIRLPISHHDDRIDGKGIIGYEQVDLSSAKWIKAHTYVLHTEDEVAAYVEQHKTFLKKNLMAKKKKHASQSTNNATSDPENDAFDTKKNNREEERGHTVLAWWGKKFKAVPKSLWNGILHMEFHVGDVPKEIVDEVYEVIAKEFDVPEKRNKYILWRDSIQGRASIRWRAFKTRFRKYWLYKVHGNKKVVRKTSPWTYPMVQQTYWNKFIKTYTEDDAFQVKELQNKGIHVTQVSRHLVWLKAHSKEKDGQMVFENPADDIIAQAIVITNYGSCSAYRGEITTKGRDDVLAKAINKPEHGGRVRVVGSAVSNKAYFGYNQPTPPNRMQAQVNYLMKEMGTMRNDQNLLMSYIISSPNFNPDQFRQFMTSGGALGGQGSVSTPFGIYVSLLGGQGLGASQFGFPMQGFGGPQFSALNGQLSGLSGQVEPNHEEILPYHVPWPEQHLMRSDQQIEQNCTSSPQRSHELIDDDPISHNQFRSGLTRHDPVSVIEHTLLSEKELHIVAKGKVEKRKSEQVITVHNVKIVIGLLRVSVDQVVIPAALIPCPTSEFTYLSEMCKQDSVAGMYRFCDIGCLSPLTPMTEEGRSDYLAIFTGVSTSYSQAKIDELRDLWVNYVHEHYKQVGEEYDDGVDYDE
uniref:Transposase n=1 Tax=Chenopodium quinoa TaxID=63459 RepID=A0A803LSK6_CHEQI